jgi:hypothetical protein
MDETDRNIPLTTTKQGLGSLSRVARWLSRLRGPARPLPSTAPDGAFDVHEALHLLPSVLDTDELPKGVVELVIEDAHTPGRCLLDIHDGEVSHVEPGTMVPWASIAGSHRNWAKALEDGDAADLLLTGDTHLAERLLAALPRPALTREPLVEQATA